MSRIFCYIHHTAGVPDDTAQELAAAAKALDASEPPIALVAGSVPEADAVCQALRASFAAIWKIADPALAYPNAELVRVALTALVPKGSIVLVAHNHFGIDLAPGLSIKLGAAYVPDTVEIQGRDGASLRLVRQEFGGQVRAHVLCDAAGGAVLTIRPGAFQPLDTPAAAGEIRECPVTLAPPRRRYVSTVAAESGDVDVTKFKVLVSIGRGIQEAENIEIAQELADSLGGAVSCSRPVVDAKWLDKSRQVGSSGKTVKPKVYLACGISGSFQHLAGIKGNPFLVAINKNPKAPIFRVADIGIVDDLLEFLPALTELVRQKKPVGAR